MGRTGRSACCCSTHTPTCGQYEGARQLCKSAFDFVGGSICLLLAELGHFQKSDGWCAAARPCWQCMTKAEVFAHSRRVRSLLGEPKFADF